MTDIPLPEPTLWALEETLSKRETTIRGYLWFSNPKNCSWAPLFTADQLREYAATVNAALRAENEALKADAARWQMLAGHWKKISAHWSKDDANEPASVVLTIDFRQVAVSSDFVDSFFDEAIKQYPPVAQEVEAAATRLMDEILGRNKACPAIAAESTLPADGSRSEG